jgi:hypothetical protein
MNKQFFMAGAFALMGFFVLTAFGGKTLAEQQAEVANAVTAKLDELRAQMDVACKARVDAEVKARYNQYLLDESAKTTSKGGVSKPAPKPATKPAPAPAPTTKPAPTTTTPSQDRWNTGQTKEQQQQQQQSQDRWNTGQTKETQQQNQQSQDRWKKSGGN